MAQNWQRQLQKSLKTATIINDYLGLDYFKDNPFPLKIPKQFADLINTDDSHDPLLLQVLPQINNSNTSFTKEPLLDNKNSPVNGIIHKYTNRVLLIVSSVCAIHCRYCFRQNFNYKNHDIFSNLDIIMSYLANNKAINEVILSGGDPLSISDDKLAKLITRIAKIKHIKNLRIHSRTIAIIPSRITNNFIDILHNTSLNVVIVFHINHPREITDELANNVKKLSNITLLNQSVLLNKVNNNVKTLTNLSNKLFAIGILPYYLHQLDKVEGAEHFLVDDKQAIKLHNNLKQQLSGYLVPKLVKDNNNSAKDWL